MRLSPKLLIHKFKTGFYKQAICKPVHKSSNENNIKKIF